MLISASGLLGLNFPARAQPALPGALAELSQLRLIGSSRYTYWGFDIYSAALWVEPGFRSNDPARSHFALELKYLRGFKGSDIARRSIEEMRRVGEFTDAQAQVWLQAMQTAFPDVDVGDRLTGINLPGQGARFLANGRCTAEVNDPEFARLFFGIWLSEKTPEAQMRLALLGLNRPAPRP